MRGARLLVAIGAVTLAAGFVLWRRAHPPRPNVLLITLDALRADHLGCYGYGRPTSPALDSLAAAGVRFKWAISPSSWTKPVIPSLLTGLFPFQHGVYEGSSEDRSGVLTTDVLPDSIVTLAEVLHGAGYTTVAYVKNAQLDPASGIGQGFDTWKTDAGDAGEIVDAFLGWCNGRPEAPFFAYLHFLDVHWPYRPRPPYDQLYPAPVSAVDFGTKRWRELREAINSGVLPLTAADRAAMSARYDEEIRYLDDQLRRLFSGLRDRHLEGQTLIIVTADHGEEFLEHGQIGHGQSLYDELLRVPLIVSAPMAAGRGRVLSAQVELIDIVPTVCDMLRVTPPAHLLGRSLFPALKGHPLEQAPAFSEVRHGRTLQRSVRTEPYKLVVVTPVPVEGVSAPRPSGGVGPDWLRPGARLEVKVERGPAGELRARRVALDEDPQDTDVELLGRIDRWAASQGHLSILGLPVLVGENTRVICVERAAPAGWECLTAGLYVKVQGDLRGEGPVVARSVEARQPEEGGKIEGLLEAVVGKGPEALVLRLGGATIRTTAETQWRQKEARAEDGERRELYDLRSDPREVADISLTRGEDVRRLQQLLDERLPVLPVRTTQRAALDSATVEGLRALGYVD